MSYLDLERLKENTRADFADITCDICKKHIDITEEPFVKTWIDDGTFHQECLDAYREARK